jgi:hypothetical protein
MYYFMFALVLEVFVIYPLWMPPEDGHKCDLNLYMKEAYCVCKIRYC